MKEICGIDEAGRGCAAGKLTICGCILNKEISGLKDSKKLSPKKREILYKEICQNSKFLCVYFDSSEIDKFGLSKCLQTGLLIIKSYFKNCEFIYDGNCNFGTNLKTLIKADSKIPQVSAASIIAKVSRDFDMKFIAKLHPEYNFDKNQGYLSKTHIEAIKKFGYTKFHRKSYKIKSLAEPSLF